jgi:hypothetical protein
VAFWSVRLLVERFVALGVLPLDNVCSCVALERESTRADLYHGPMIVRFKQIQLIFALHQSTIITTLIYRKDAYDQNMCGSTITSRMRTIVNHAQEHLSDLNDAGRCVRC